MIGIVAAAGCVQVLGDFHENPTTPPEGGAPDTGGPADAGAEGGGPEASAEAEASPPSNFITDAVQVSAGEHHTCAIRAGGNVYCWGANGSGQLGIAPTTAMSNRPLKVPMISQAVQVSAGYLHTCAVDVNHALWCWGANDSAQLGLGTTTTTELPQIVSTGMLSGVAQVSGGERHTCAVSSSGDVYCWGANDVGQIAATGGITSYPSPTLVSLPNSDSATQVSAASHHSCAVLQSAPYLACWGTQAVGELGTATTGVEPPTAPTIASTPSFLGTAAGHDHSCGVDSTHQVWCWGGDLLGQTGATPAASAVPAVVGGTGSVLVVTTGSAFTCALNNAGDVYCWGSNSNAQLGGGASPDMTPHATPAKVIMLTGAAQVSGGSEHACAILQGTVDGGVVAGPLLCWGNNAEGEIGDGTAVMSRAAPTPVLQN
jgi:alpha-tubulin suppressor-like RCC1 family protein